MDKTPCVFRHSGGLALPEYERGCEWVGAGEGVATHKWDGTCASVRGGRVLARLTVKGGKQAPEWFIPYDAEQASLDITHKRYGWVPCHLADSKSWYAQWWEKDVNLLDGTYELCGPGIQSNVECFSERQLIRHGDVVYTDMPLDFEGIRAWLAEHRRMEGIVFHHPDGRRAKIRHEAFGSTRLPRLENWNG